VASLMQELRSRKISPKRALGQHFLIDQGIAQKIVRLADLEPEDCVVEIGPGMGVLTFLMLPLVKKMIAVELDQGMADYLRERAAGMASLTVLRRDALGFDFAKAARDVDRKIKVVANLPYNISTPVIFRLLESREALARLTLMLQREVAQRITASPGNKAYGPLAIFTQLYTSPKIMMLVPPEAFYPSPKVESALVGFEILERPRIAIDDHGFFQKVVRASFAQRRKTLLNALKGSSLPLGPKDKIEAALVAAGINPRCRAETLDLAEFQRLAEALEKGDRNPTPAPVGTGSG
jgi:16S rRNA (adenine1518-N6/adenine1519-N6)-dimethyltransferase